MHVRRALVPVLCLAISSCSVQGLAFRIDDRLQIVNLADRSTIEIPFDLHFTFDGTLSSDGVAAFGILIDWTPPPPGKSLASLLEDDPACQGQQGCPDGYLERNRIVITTDRTYLMDNVPVGTDRQERRGFHELTIVLVDADGRRIGETAAFARFRTPGVNA
jgi:hypothetical protein